MATSIAFWMAFKLSENATPLRTGRRTGLSSQCHASTPSWNAASRAASATTFAPPLPFTRTSSPALRCRWIAPRAPSKQDRKSNGSTATTSIEPPDARSAAYSRRNPGSRRDFPPAISARRSYPIERSARRTFSGLKPNVEMRTRSVIGSAHEEFGSGRRADQVRAGVLGVRSDLRDPLRDELLHVVVHRALVDSESLREARLVRRSVPVGYEVREDLLLLRGQVVRVVHPEQGELDLLVRLVVDVRRRDPLEDAHEEGRAAHQPGAARDVEADRRRAVLAGLPDVLPDSPRDFEEIERVAQLHRRRRDAERVAQLHHLRAGRPRFLVGAMVEHDPLEAFRGLDRRHQALGPPSESTE